ncbi:MAG TPA: OadG family protein [Candidatus Faecousia intestinigallinarum]|nr:OadG family protein [Candidatus Faecousia intestinigallinarum]
MQLLANTLGQSHLSIGDAGIVALLGYIVVFFGLVLLLAVLVIVGKIFAAKDAKAKANTPAPAAAPAAAEAPKPTAPGAAGSLKLYDVEPKTAAMLMAIVADKMGKPLNELRFISIKEVK